MTNCNGFHVFPVSGPSMESQGRPGTLTRTAPDTPRIGPQGGPLHPQIGTLIRQACGRGQPLEGTLRERMGVFLNHDFGGVRVHTGPEADELNGRFGARGFAVGSDIFFAQGAYDPTSLTSRELIAHELVHIVQQRQGLSGEALPIPTIGSADDPLEREAASLAARAVGQPLSCADRGGITVRLRARHTWMVLRALADVCRTPAPAAMNGISCHTTTLWWIYKARTNAPSDENGWEHFTGVLGNRAVNDLIADLIQRYGRQREQSLWFRVRSGAVVVFADARTPVAVQAGHSCVCGGSNNLYGHSQGGWFSTCNHGNAGVHCHHWATRINWYEGTNLYQVDPADALAWAAQHL